ncbi:hypothetical protein AB0M02_41105 [Actinoplanes sp. NPDC051861]|uniref:hypothetical protein n=1 Tax=Actinoplanes sp. NPDC051861 TaxID=3155170 RepID=UPI00343B957B
MGYWWEGDKAERFWVEIRWQDGIGTQLWAPTLDEKGKQNPWYDLVSTVVAGDVIYHWNTVEMRFVGRSKAASDARVEPAETGQAFIVDLEEFTPLRADLSLGYLRLHADELYSLRDELDATYEGRPLYLPWQFYEDRSQFRSMSNYFTKIPRRAVSILFGVDGLGTEHLPQEATQDRPQAAPSLPQAPTGHRGFLAPFKPKADADYFTRVVGGAMKRGRSHETLVNSCADWLSANGFEPGCNNAIDLGVAELSVIIEAKIVRRSWSDAIREAVGQLYEYRYFKVADPESSLIFLADRPVQQFWVDYLEKDRGIGVMWPVGDGFHMSKLARQALRR